VKTRTCSLTAVLVGFLAISACADPDDPELEGSSDDGASALGSDAELSAQPEPTASPDDPGPGPGGGGGLPPIGPTDAIVGMGIAGQTGVAYAWTGVSTVSAGIFEHLTSIRSPYRWTASNGSSLRATAINASDQTYAWFSNGSGGRGNTANPTASLTFAYTLPVGRTTSDIVDFAIRKSDNRVYAYYDDGKFSWGTHTAPGSSGCCLSYALPPGLTVADIVGMDFDPQQRLVTWFDDGTYTIGTYNDLDFYQGPRRYARHGFLASKWPADAPGVAAPVSDWPPDISNEGNPSPPVLAPPAETFDVSGTGADMLVAAGTSAIAVAGDASVRFYAKDGTPLTGGPLGNSNALPLGEMFDPFRRTQAVTPGEESPLDVNLYSGFPLPCDDPSYAATQGYRYCVSSSPYDTRVHWDPVGSRWVVLANLRNYVFTNYFQSQYDNPGLSDEELFEIELLDYGTCGAISDPSHNGAPVPEPEHCKLARRLLAVAVSRTDDPRDGFYTYVLIENNYRDWPWMAVDGDWMILSHLGAEQPGGAAATLVSLADMRLGKVRPQYINYYAADLGGRVVVEPPQQNGTWPDHSLVVDVSGNNWWFFALPHPPQPYAKQPAGALATVLSEVGTYSREGAVYRHDALHLVRGVQTPVPNAPELATSEVQQVRLPLWRSGDTPVVSQSAAMGFASWTHTSSDPDALRVEEPVLAVNGKNEVLVAWARAGVYPDDQVPPGVEHTIARKGALATFFDLRRDFRTGDGYAEGYPSDQTKAIAAAVDPVDERTMWVAQKYGGSNGDWKVVVGSVDPTQYEWP
jgi:hypothetical protein